MSKSKVTSERPNSAFCLISSYLEKIGVSSSLSDTKEWLFPYDVGYTSGALNRIFRDEFPTGQEIWNPSDSNETYTDLLDQYSRKLFPAVLAKSDYNLRPFYQTLASAMELLRNKSEADLPKRLQHSTSAAGQLADHFRALASQPTSQQYSDPQAADVFKNALYVAMYFIATGFIVPKFSEQFNGLEQDRREFTQEVLSKFGCSGDPGVFAIYHLADRVEAPNVIALFEAGELEYYGKGFSSTPNYANAYAYYIQAAEGKVYNPLASWSLGYMLYYYHNARKKKNKLLDAEIPELDAMSTEARYAKALAHLKLSFDCGCPAAGNVLAAMIDDPNVPAFYKDKLYPAEVYLQAASDHGYVFAKNNLYNRYWNESLSLPEEKDKEVKALREKALALLKESADLGEPWATNKYARHMLDAGQLSIAYSYFRKGHRAQFDFSTLNLLKEYYLPALKNADKAVVYGDLITLEMARQYMKTVLHSETKDVVDQAEELEASYHDVLTRD